VGATFIKVAGDYAGQLAERGGRLYLTGLEPSLTERLVRTGHVEDGPVRTSEATPIVGESTQRAYLDAEAWLVMRRGE
jgi:SulP family sulfate permease